MCVSSFQTGKRKTKQEKERPSKFGQKEEARYFQEHKLDSRIFLLPEKLHSNCETLQEVGHQKLRLDGNSHFLWSSIKVQQLGIEDFSELAAPRDILQLWR